MPVVQIFTSSQPSVTQHYSLGNEGAGKKARADEGVGGIPKAHHAEGGGGARSGMDLWRMGLGDE